jgi:hypothetical protein
MHMCAECRENHLLTKSLAAVPGRRLYVQMVYSFYITVWFQPAGWGLCKGTGSVLRVHNGNGIDAHDVKLSFEPSRALSSGRRAARIPFGWYCSP